MQNRFALLPIAAAIVVAGRVRQRISTVPASTPVVSKIVNRSARLTPCWRATGPLVANTTTGSGTFVATLDTSTNVFTYERHSLRV